MNLNWEGPLKYTIYFNKFIAKFFEIRDNLKKIFLYLTLLKEYSI